MDLWNFKKWRKKLGYTQAEAGERLGYSRAAVQYWEAESPVPLAVELACRELLRPPPAIRATSEQRKRHKTRGLAKADHDPRYSAHCGRRWECYLVQSSAAA